MRFIKILPICFVLLLMFVGVSNAQYCSDFKDCSEIVNWESRGANLSHRMSFIANTHKKPKCLNKNNLFFRAFCLIQSIINHQHLFSE